MKRAVLGLFATFAILSLAEPSHAQFVGVTCGFSSGNLDGPSNTTANTPMFNLLPGNQARTWDDFAEELGASGVEYIAPDLRGTTPNTGAGNPANLGPLVTALTNRGLSNKVKIAIFDDNAASWCAQWNSANGRGYGYAQPFDISNSANWTYIWDTNYKVFYQTVPDANRFKINGRPVIIIWTGNTTFIGNMQGNASRALTYVRQQCQATFGFNPYIIVSGDFLGNDTTCNDPTVVDAIENWFRPGSSAYTLATFNGVNIGALCPQFQTPAYGTNWIDPNHGVTFDNALVNTHGAGALLTLIEGFTDWEEDASVFRVRNLDPTGASLTYANTYYDYPNQRINILRKDGNNPFPADLKEEAEACDTFGGGAANTGSPNFYRNGNIKIEATTDTGKGYDVGDIHANEWLEWQAVPIQGTVHIGVRIASTVANTKLHFVIDGTTYPTITLPNTGGWQTWTTLDAGAYTFPMNTTHTVRLVCETTGFNVNYWQLTNIIPIGKTISLQSMSNNKYVTADAAGVARLIANSTTAGTPQLFTIIDKGNGLVALQAMVNGEYVSADAAGTQPLINNRTVAGVYETFQWITNTNGTISLRAVINQEFVCADSAGASPLIANRPGHGLWESYTVAIH